MISSLKIRPHWGRLSALVGSVVWLLLFLFQIGDSPETALVQRLVLFAILVVVPLALSLVPAPDSRPMESRLYQLALLAQPFGAMAAVASFLMKPGLPAGGFAFLWFCVTALIALRGLERLSVRELRSPPEISIAAGFVYLPVGSSWMIVSRLGIQLLGFGDTIILLTAIHFHYAAYAAPILAGLAGRKLSEYGSANKSFKFVPIGIIAGTPLVAAGITFSPITALLGAVMISCGLFLLAILIIGWLAHRIESLTAKILLLVSSLSSATGMVLACIYAYSVVAQKLLIDIPQMATTHGLINAFGFVLCGLVAWTLIERGGNQRDYP